MPAKYIIQRGHCTPGLLPKWADAVVFDSEGAARHHFRGYHGSPEILYRLIERNEGRHDVLAGDGKIEIVAGGKHLDPQPPLAPGPAQPWFGEVTDYTPSKSVPQVVADAVVEALQNNQKTVSAEDRYDEDRRNFLRQKEVELEELRKDAHATFKAAEALTPVKRLWEPLNESITIQGRNYNVSAAVFAARDLPVLEMRIDQMFLSYLSPAEDRFMDFCSHVRMVNEADLSFPILLNENGSIINGKHRLAKAVVTGLKTIKCQRFVTDPPSCYTNE